MTGNIQKDHQFISPRLQIAKLDSCVWFCEIRFMIVIRMVEYYIDEKYIKNIYYFSSRSVARNRYSDDCALLKCACRLGRGLIDLFRGWTQPPLPFPPSPSPFLLSLLPPWQPTLGGTRVIVLDHSHYLQPPTRQPCEIAADTVPPTSCRGTIPSRLANRMSGSVYNAEKGTICVGRKVCEAANSQKRERGRC